MVNNYLSIAKNCLDFACVLCVVCCFTVGDKDAMLEEDVSQRQQATLKKVSSVKHDLGPWLSLDKFFHDM